MTAPTTLARYGRRVAAWLCAAALTGCASTGNGALKTLTQERAAQMIVVGKSSKADMAAAFGAASITPFANGYEVWLYQLGYSNVVDAVPYVNLVLHSADNPKELSILFDRTGLVKKFRLMDRALE